MKVFKWDNDLAVVLPQALLDQFALKEGDDIKIVATEREVTAEPKDEGNTSPG